MVSGVGDTGSNLTNAANRCSATSPATLDFLPHPEQVPAPAGAAVCTLQSEDLPTNIVLGCVCGNVCYRVCAALCALQARQCRQRTPCARLVCTSIVHNPVSTILCATPSDGNRGRAAGQVSPGQDQGVGTCERASPSTFFGEMCLERP